VFCWATLKLLYLGSRLRGNDRLGDQVMKNYFVYIMASKKDGVLYVGVTNDLKRRVYEHRNGLVDGFTREYRVHKLVYYERFDYVDSAINREKCVKKWRRQWKLNLIEKFNPGWDDLYCRV